MKTKGHLFILSGPSGVGKTVIQQKLLQRVENLERVITFTTRQPRPGEKNGVHYHFVDETTFQDMIRKDAFLEWAKVHDHHYGTPRDHIMDKLQAGTNLLMIVDVQGAMAIREKVPEFHLIFLQPDDPENLLKHLEARKKITEEEKELRLKNARKEMGYRKHYDFVITNKEGRIKDTLIAVEDIILSTIRKPHPQPTKAH